MKIVLSFLFFCLLAGSCKKNNEKNDASNYTACLKATFLPTSIQDAFQSVFFLNGKEGFVSGYNGGIFKTTDSAKNWIRLNSTLNLPIRSLFFTDSLNGFAAGGQNVCGGTGCIPPGGFILRTQDGGTTWVQVYTPLNKIEISSVYFVNASTGFCIGDNVIIKTSNGGQTWSEQRIDNLGGKMKQVAFLNPQKGYIVCLSDKILKTEDGGSSWQISSPGHGSGYFSISAANGSLYISGQDKILKSINEGNSWIEQANSPADIFAVHFIDDMKGFAFGRGNYSGGDFGRYYGSIYCTTDGGITWNGTADVKETVLISAVSFPSNDIGYAVGGNIVIRINTN
ncbi:MAG: WD40/YVTN/BNR-like repeat-containing protein [Chitinophagales bacterium]